MLIVQRWGFKGPSNRRRRDTHFEPDGVIFWTYLALPTGGVSRKPLPVGLSGRFGAPGGNRPATLIILSVVTSFIICCADAQLLSCDPPRSFP